MRYLYILILLTFYNTLSAQTSMNVGLLCNWDDTTNIRLNRTGQRYNDVWGFTWAGKEYAAIGSTEGVHIIDINQCKQIAFYRGADTGTNIIHRDYKTYKNYLYAVCDEGASTLQIFDLSYLPDSLHLVYESDPVFFMLCHNIFIDTVKATMYACSPKSIMFGADDIRVYSLVDPENPILTHRRSEGIPVHDVYVRKDTAYCSSSGYGYEVFDFNYPPDVYQKIAELRFYPYQGYNHSSWINEKGFGVMADETFASPLKVIDTRNLQNIRVLSTFSPRPNDSTCVPHNPYLVGDFVFISHYMDGLQIYDISDPYDPRHAGFYDTYPYPDYKGFAGAWGCYPYLPSRKVLVSDMQSGLYVFDVSEATKPQDTLENIQTFTVTNPVRGQLTFQLPKEDTGVIGIQVVDMSGKQVWAHRTEVYSYTIQPIQLTLPGTWARGMYILQVNAGRHTYIRKVIKM